MFSVPPAYTISPFGDDSYDSHRTNILGLGFPLFVSPHYYILQAVRRGGLFCDFSKKIYLKGCNMKKL